jgi:hypothetical protein
MTKHKGFSASRISDLLAGGTGKTRSNYIFEIAENHVGAKKDITTQAMYHGINNEVYAISILTSIYGGKANTDENGNQVSYKVNDYLSATPDALSDSWVGDAKCQYSIHGFFEQNDKLSSKYHLQVQTQMMALKVDKGYLINFLTKPEKFGQDDWEEYQIELDRRYHVHEINKEPEIQDQILMMAEKHYPEIGLCIDILGSANVIDHSEFFQRQFFDKVRFTKLKDCNWLENDKTVFRYENDFYVIKNSKVTKSNDF